VGATGDLARSIVESNRRAAGVQVVVTAGGRTICDEGCGLAGPGRPMTPDTIQSLFCLTKPLVAAAACALAEAKGFSIDDDVRELSLGAARRLGAHRCTLRDVLSHAAGLHDVRAAEVMFMPVAARQRALDSVPAVAEWNVGRDHAYSEFHGWNVLRVLIEDAYHVPFGAALRQALLEPLGLDDVYFGVTDAEWVDVRERLGVHYAIEDGYTRPLLHELLRKHLDDRAMQTIGGYGSARALAAFYAAVLAVGRGCSRAGLPSPALTRAMVQPTAPPAVDPVLTARLSFGLGFMTDLADLFGPAAGPDAFGHMGLLGSSFAFADPACDLVVVFVSNGFLTADDDRLETRVRLIEAARQDALVTA
jgi:CubicO group peptidase (beta-lactamase class C family)